MTWRPVLTAAVVFAATGLTTIVIVSPYAASPVQEYIAVPSLLVLDLAAAIGIASACCAAALIGRPSNAVVPCGLTGAALLADAWIGHGLSPGFQALGFAAVPLLPSTIAFAPAVAGIERSRALIVSTRALLCVGVAAAVVSVVTYDPYLDLSCQRDCLQNPLLVANVHSVALLLRLAEGAACVGWCLVAIRDFRNGYGARVILAATAGAVAVSALRLVTLTFTSDDPQATALRVLHVGVASCVLVVGAAIAYELEPTVHSTCPARSTAARSASRRRARPRALPAPRCRRRDADARVPSPRRSRRCWLTPSACRSPRATSRRTSTPTSASPATVSP